MRMKCRAVIAAVILICFILQSTLFQALAIGSISPNLLLILTVSFGFMRGKESGLWIGFACGLLKDLFYGNLLGFYTLIYLCIGYAAGYCCKIFYNDEIRVPLLLMAAGDLLSGILIYGTQFLMRGRVNFFIILAGSSYQK